MEYVIISIAGLLIWTWLLYMVVRYAVTNAMRRARHEARIEQHLPKAATWLNADEKQLLEASRTHQP